MVDWTTGLGEPLLIQMLEDEHGVGTVTVETTGQVLSIEATNPPTWLHIVANGNSLECTAILTDSPFSYRVESVDNEYQSHSTNRFLDVPCDQRTYAYTRLDSGILTYSLSLIAQVREVDEVSGLNVINTYSHTVMIEIRANYSIGKTALLGVLQCQP